MRRSGVLVEMVVRRWRCVWERESLLSSFFWSWFDFLRHFSTWILRGNHLLSKINIRAPFSIKKLGISCSPKGVTGTQEDRFRWRNAGGDSSRFSVSREVFSPSIDKDLYDSFSETVSYFSHACVGLERKRNFCVPILRSKCCTYSDNRIIVDLRLCIQQVCWP